MSPTLLQTVWLSVGLLQRSSEQPCLNPTTACPRLGAWHHICRQMGLGLMQWVPAAGQTRFLIAAWPLLQLHCAWALDWHPATRHTCLTSKNGWSGGRYPSQRLLRFSKACQYAYMHALLGLRIAKIDSKLELLISYAKHSRGSDRPELSQPVLPREAYRNVQALSTI